MSRTDSDRRTQPARPAPPPSLNNTSRRRRGGAARFPGGSRAALRRACYSGPAHPAPRLRRAYYSAGSTALGCRCPHDRRRLAQARSLPAGPGSGPPALDRRLGRPEPSHQPSRQQAVGGLPGDGLDRLEILTGRSDAATARRTPRSTTAAPAAAHSPPEPPLLAALARPAGG